MTEYFLESLGWLSTIMILLGYYFNSKSNRTAAFITWIAGDFGWVIYDLYISNWSHMLLSFIIIFLNLYGMYSDGYFKNMFKRVSNEN